MQSLNQTVNSSMSRSQRYFQANEAGQKATIDTVEAVTNQKIDHFAEVNLAGFFYLAQSFGGIEVPVQVVARPRRPGQRTCTTRTRASTHRTRATCTWRRIRRWRSSGKRDNLPNGDLDRTHRQQAVLDYVIWKLKAEGVLTDLGQLDRPARHRPQVPHHRLELEPARLLDPDARPDRSRT